MSEPTYCPKCKLPNIERVGDPFEIQRKVDGVRECFMFQYQCKDCGTSFAAFFGPGSRDVINRLTSRIKKEIE